VTWVIIVHGDERRELAVAQAMATLVMQGQLAVRDIHPGTSALEAIGAIAGHLFQARALGKAWSGWLLWRSGSSNWWLSARSR
jgi:hypothetical protein